MPDLNLDERGQLRFMIVNMLGTLDSPHLNAAMKVGSMRNWVKSLKELERHINATVGHQMMLIGRIHAPGLIEAHCTCGWQSEPFDAALDTWHLGAQAAFDEHVAAEGGDDD